MSIRSLDPFIIYLLIFFMTLSNYKQIASFIILKLSANIIRQIVKDQDIIIIIFFLFLCLFLCMLRLTRDDFNRFSK